MVVLSVALASSANLVSVSATSKEDFFALKAATVASKLRDKFPEIFQDVVNHIPNTLCFATFSHKPSEATTTNLIVSFNWIKIENGFEKEKEHSAYIHRVNFRNCTNEIALSLKNKVRFEKDENEFQPYCKDICS